MKQVIVLLFLSVPLFCRGQNDSETTLVKNTFSNYKKSILESNGSEAVKWVDSKTLSYYEKMLKLSIFADSTEVQELAITDKLTLFTVRHRIPKKEILEMDGKGFFIYAINNGMVGKNSVITVEIGEVKVSDNFANGRLLSNGKESPLYFQFNKEEGLWKLDITSLFPATNMGLKQMISSNGMTENEFIFQSLEMLTGKPLDENIWAPLK